MCAKSCTHWDQAKQPAWPLSLALGPNRIQNMKKLNLDEFLDDAIPKGWKSACISIHSHWLTEEEASIHWMSYVGLSGQSDPNWEQYKSAEERFVQLFKSLHQECGLTIWNQEISDNAIASVSNSIEEVVIKNTREERFDVFYSGSLNLVLLGNFDLTFPIFIPVDHDWSLIHNIALKCGLNVLH